MTKHFPRNRNSRIARLARAVFDRGLRGWTFSIHIGPGAGYGRWVLNRKLFIPTGWTLWIGRNVRGGRARNGAVRDMYRDRKWSLGITRCGGGAPYAAH